MEYSPRKSPMARKKINLGTPKIEIANPNLETPNNRSMEETNYSKLMPTQDSNKLTLNLHSKTLKRKAIDSTKGKKMESRPTSPTSNSMDLASPSSSSSNGHSSKLSSS